MLESVLKQGPETVVLSCSEISSILKSEHDHLISPVREARTSDYLILILPNSLINSHPCYLVCGEARRFARFWGIWGRLAEARCR